MARGRQFSELIADLKDEIGHSSNVAVGVDYQTQLKYDINRAYESLYDDYFWPHLRLVADRIPLAAGDRFYDFPADMSLEGLESVEVWYSNQPLPVERGVGMREYALLDPDADARSDPVQKWDTQWDAGTSTVQIEVWPLPSSNNQELQLIGKVKLSRLVEDADVCHLDDRLVVLFAAARRLKRSKSPDADLALAEAQQRLSTLRARTGPSARVIMGGGETIEKRNRSTVVIAGS
jgi:hypothetical protein